jgi:hypothetical protein
MPSAAEYVSQGDMVAGPPLDYSFKELKSVLEMETEEPRSGGKRRPQIEKDATAAGQADAAADTAAAGGAAATEQAGDTTKMLTTGLANASAHLGGSGKGGAVVATQLRPNAAPIMKRRIRKVTLAVKLNNNMIDSIRDLPAALEFAMDDPLRNLQWIDLSFNQLQTIQSELLEFKHLKALYLHGNHIKSLPQVERLRRLQKLISLTLNGNPIECFPFYRRYVIGALTELRSLDHSTITDDEVKGASDWFVAHEQRAKARKERLEEAMLSMNE